MAKPQKRTFDTDLPDWRTDPARAWLLLRVTSPIPVQKAPNDPEREILKVTFEVLTEPWGSRDPRTKTTQIVGNTVNSMGDGTPSKLTQLINASQSADLAKAELEEFDSDMLANVVIEACGEVKTGDNGSFWRVKAFRRPSATPVVPVTPTAAPSPASDSYQYTPDGKYRWKDGMTEWEPVPQAPPPPPAPAAVAAPSPPPAGPPPAPTGAPPAAPALRF